MKRPGGQHASNTSRSGSAALGLALVLCLSAWLIAPTTPRPDFEARAGVIIAADVEESLRDGRLHTTAQLRTSTGLQLRIRCMRSAELAGALPTALIIGGLRTGADGVDVAGDPGGIVVAAIDYPYAGPTKLKGLREILAAAPSVRRAVHDTPAAALVALRWLRTLAFVDSERIELVGASLGTPFSLPAAGIDGNVRRLWILQGGAGYAHWFEHALKREIDAPLIRTIVARATLRWARSANFRPSHWLDRLGPRPLVIVASRVDERVPKRCVAELLQLASGPVEIHWIDLPHIERDRLDVAAALLAAVRPRIESGR